MTDLTPVSSFDPVPQLETSTVALAGPGGPMNSQGQALLNRTKFLNDKIDQASTDLANFVDATKGSGEVGWVRSVLLDSIKSAGAMLSAQAISPWEFASLVTSKPTPSDPSTWDWTPAFKAMNTAVASSKVKLIALFGTFRLVGGLLGSSYEWSGVTFISAGAQIILDTPTGDNVGLQIGSNVVIKGHLKGSVVNGTSNGNGFVRTPICIGRWFDAATEVQNVHIDSLDLTGMSDGTAIAIAGNAHGVRIGRLSMGAGQLGLMAHWAGVPNNVTPTSTYHPHDIRIGSLIGSGFTEAMVTESACYDVRIDYINGQNNYRDINHIGGDFGDTYAVARDAGKVCKGNSFGRIESVGATYRSVDYNANAGLIVNIMLGELSIDSIKAIGTGAASSVGIRIENREVGRIGLADISGFANNIVQINCNGGTDGELRSSLATTQGILYTTSNHIRADILRTTNDNQSAGGGISGVQVAGTSADIEIGQIRVATNNTATHGCVLNSSTTDIRIRKVGGAVDASRSLLVDNAAANVNRIGPCILDSGTQSYSGPDPYAKIVGRGNAIGWGSTTPTSGSSLRGDLQFTTLASGGGSMGNQCSVSGVNGSTAVFKAMPNLAP
jgi:hypothetical protein